MCVCVCVCVCPCAGANGADLKKALKEACPEGVDVVYDPVGGPYSEIALRSMAWRGRFLVIGFAAGDIPQIPLNLALLKGCSIVGVWPARAHARVCASARPRVSASARLRVRFESKRTHSTVREQ